MGNKQNLPKSQHFQLSELSDGVYAAIQTADGWAVGNAGIIDLGGHTVVFDTFLAPQAATELCKAAEVLTGRPVTTIINSHYHSEHFWGNQVFDASTNIIATTATHDHMATKGAQEVIQQQESVAAQLANLEKRQQAAKKEKERQQLKMRLRDCQAIMATLPTLTLRLPNITFDSRLVLHGTQRRAEVISYGPGHTQGDAFLYLPAEKILFAGDLVSVGYHPYLADGDPGEVNRILDIIGKLQPKFVVPGHGEIGDMQDVQATARYITLLAEMALIELTYKLENSAQLDEKIAQLPIPKQFAAWLHTDFFAANLRFLYERLMKAYSD
jgi:cyclase